MLMNILNLPYKVRYSDIKALLMSTCGVEDVVLDNLTTHDKGSKKITIGLASNEDAAMLMRKINGYYMDGYQLQVVPKQRAQTQMPPAPNPQPLGPPSRPNWSAPMPPPLVPPLMNMDYNKTAFYQLNQPSYPDLSAPSTSNVAPLMSYPFGNQSNVNRQVSWTGNYGGVQTTQTNMNQETEWHKSNWEPNRGSGRDNEHNNQQWSNNYESGWSSNQAPATSRGDSSRDSNRPNKSEPVWEPNRVSRWGEAGDSDRNNSRDSNRNHNRDANRFDNRDSNINYSRDLNRNDNRDSIRSYSRDSNRNDNRDSIRNDNRDSIRNYTRDSNRNDNRDSNRNDVRASNWSTGRDPGRDISRDVKWHENRDNNRNSYRPNQTAETPRDRNVSYNRQDQDNKRSLPRQDAPFYGSHAVESTIKYEFRNDKFRQSQSSRPQTRTRYRADRAPSPRPKRPRIEEDSKLVKSEPVNTYKPAKKQPKYANNDEFKRQLEKAENLRTQFVEQLAKLLLTSPAFEYETPDLEELRGALKRAIRYRLDIVCKYNYTMNMQEIREAYERKYVPRNNWVLLRDTLMALGGRLIKPDKTKGKKVPGQKGKKKTKMPVAPKYGEVFGNLKIDRRIEPKEEGPQSATSSSLKAAPKNEPKAPAKPKPQVDSSNPNSTPLHLIPGRIPRNPDGDFRRYRDYKALETNLFEKDDVLASKIKKISPARRAALHDEMKKLLSCIASECMHRPQKEASFCNYLVPVLTDLLKRVLTIHMVKRLVPILPTSLCVKSTPVMKRMPLEQFLLPYNVVSLKSVKKRPIYIALFNSFADQDKLVYTKHEVDGHQVSFSANNLLGVAEKVAKTDIFKKRVAMKKTFIRHSNNVLGIPEDEIEEALLAKKVNPAAQLRRDIDKLHDEITGGNETEDIETETADNAEANVYVSPVEFDSAAEASINAIMENYNEDDCLPIVENIAGDCVEIVDDQNQMADYSEPVSDDNKVGDGTGITSDDSVIENTEKVETVDLVDDDEDQGIPEVAEVDSAQVEDIDLADVNDDDLEDW